ncbi:MAG TPA: hypothetical protein VF811_03155 [Parasulfuritortus sp.]
MNLPHENLPAWAAWLAQDADGAWWCYEAEPNQHDTGWYENEVGRIAKVGQGAPNPAWREALVRVARESARP